ncbi:winged helix-turn-helix domain-containing protein [Nocardia flavorosea]|uniref:BTAD domain-containing putative transcriptional regulator n=1 Tax=Nocardia flavorosea TaxID=53429 RepID=UPI001894C1BF|nr:BTAD domain-containing putative transcriptional regulator [Nocardia flavorosea]MBF6349510.1 winged helix-turn-helix domain-containing protein [Nocardia flavorosea]
MQIVLLGPLEIRAEDGGSIEVPGARLRALLIALALEPGRVVPKTTLVDWIWGEQPPADASNALQALVSRLRRVLPEGALDGEAGGYRLVVEPNAVDAVRFEQLVDRARGSGDALRAELLREAIDLWRGTPMQGVEVRDSEAVDAVVTRFEGLHSAALEDLYEAEIGLGRGAQLVPELTELVARNPVRERLVAALMRALGAAGRGSEALLVYQNAREALADTLGVDPSPELSALHVALLRGDVGAQHNAERRTNLRAELTEYVGKFADIAAVRDLIAGHRLTTLTGPGGSGKTRLAVETAHTLLDDLPDGAWLVELAAVGTSGDVAQAALAAIGLRDALLGGASHTEPVDRLIAAVRDRETLLILDNCEHVIESVAVFAHRVLGECPRLRILATSREPLGITGEALWQVEPLALPAVDADPAGIEASPAVQLLRDRARVVRKDLGNDPRTLETMVRVCRALDGIPLAIELAAARLRTLSLDQLAERLDDRFRLLTGGSRTAIAQHRTLRAVVDWSWELLTDPERAVLRRLAVFAGDASLEAAEQVCADGGDGQQVVVEQLDVLDLLTTLTEKSLLIPAEHGAAGDVTGVGPDMPGGARERQPRFRMLETIRQYACERLAESGEAETARRAHLAYFTGLAETAEPHLRRAAQLEWLVVLEAEHDNISAALRTALAAGDTSGAWRLAAAAGWYWWLGGYKAEGQELLTAVADEPAEVDDATRALVYGLVTHFMSSGRNDAVQVGEWIRKAHRFSRGVRAGHPTLAFIDALDAMLQGPEALPTAFEPLLTDDDPWVRALSRLQMGKMRVVVGQDGPEVDAYLEGALAEFRALGERWGISFALTELANRRATRGDFVSACELYEEAIAVVAEIGSAEDIVALLSRQAQLYWLAGDPVASAAAVAEAQRRANRVAWPFALVELALARAELARWSGDIEQALEQVDIATTVSGDEAGLPQFVAAVHTLRGYLETDLARAREHHAAAFRASTEAGHSLLVAQVLVGIADWVLRAGSDAEAARLLAVSRVVHGVPDRSQPDAARVERTVRDRLGDAEFTEAMREGATADWRELAATALAR